MAQFWQLLKDSVIIQGTITLALVGATIYLAATGQEIPDSIASATALALGFYFGSKAQQFINSKAGG